MERIEHGEASNRYRCRGASGALDGLSAWFSPEARPQIVGIVLASTGKGMVVGYLAGLVANRRQSVAVGVLAGLLFGMVLSFFAALGQGDHYLEIVLPGMLVGALAGFITQRYPPRGSAAVMALLPMLTLGAVVAVMGSPAVQQQSNPAEPLAPLSSLVGRWKGTTEGQPGTGSVERVYEIVLGGRFIRVRNRSEYPPQPKNPKGETHEDEGFYSYDRGRKRIVFRQFHIEGFVNTYLSEPASSGSKLIFTSEAIENIPAGWRARETYVLHGVDSFEETFELAEAGKDFEVYSRARFERIK